MSTAYPPPAPPPPPPYNQPIPQTFTQPKEKSGGKPMIAIAIALVVVLLGVFALWDLTKHDDVSTTASKTAASIQATVTSLDPDLKTGLDKKLADADTRDSLCTDIEIKGKDGAKQDFLDGAKDNGATIDDSELEAAWAYVLSQVSC